jgi:hypothetical protein
MKAALHISILTCFILSTLVLSASARAETDPIIERSEVNSQIGYEIRLPQGWTDLSPLLIGLYNTQAAIFATEDTMPTLLSAGFSKPSSAPIPPALLLLFSRAPEGIHPGEIAGYNQLFLDEAKDTAGKSQMARQTGLATDVTFLGSDELRHNTPIFINGVSTTLGFQGKLMSIPFYTKEGVLTLLFFAKDDEFDALASEVREIARNLIIFSDKLP